MVVTKETQRVPRISHLNVRGNEGNFPCEINHFRQLRRRNSASARGASASPRARFATFIVFGDLDRARATLQTAVSRPSAGGKSWRTIIVRAAHHGYDDEEASFVTRSVR